MKSSYVKKIFELESAPALIPFFRCKNALKEWTESFGCFYAWLEFLSKNDAISENDWTVIVPGDGCMPRTAAVFAYLTKFVCHSVDPLLYSAEKCPPVERLTYHRLHAEDCEIDCTGTRALIVGCHSHAPLNDAVRIPVNAIAVDLVWMPCCAGTYPADKWMEPDFVKRHQVGVFEDKQVMSPKRQIYVYSGVRTA
jgi:hypothetical protein